MANRLGFLNFPFTQNLFAKAYFTYKSSIEDPFTPLVRRYPLLFSGGHILDVGANIGYTAVLFANVVSPGFQVHAFEPEARNFKMLKRAISRRGLKTVIPVHAAVGDEKGTAELWLNSKHHADHRMVTQSFRAQGGETQQVSVIRIDDYCASQLPGQPVRFIKIDVQGFEESVCRGMSNTLAQNPQAIIGLEYYPEGIEDLGFKPLNISRFFQERGYRVHSLTRRQGLKAIPYDQIAAAAARASYIDLLFSKSDTILDGATSWH